MRNEREREIEEGRGRQLFRDLDGASGDSKA